MKRRFLSILFYCATHAGLAQYFQFSQYNFTPTRVNPGWLGLTKNVVADFDYRNQKTGGGFDINSSFFAMAYPFLRQSTGSSWGGIGVSLTDDRSAGIFKTQEASLSFALNISTGKYENLSIGVRALTRSQRIDYSGLFTGSQYIQGRGFDGSAFNGESPDQLRINYNTFSTGMLWTKTDRRGSLLGQVDAALFDFNKPYNAFTGGGSQLSSTLVSHGTFLLNKQPQLNTYADVLFSYGDGNSVFNVGTRWQYDLNPRSRTLTDKVDLITRYVVGRSGIVGLQFHKEKFSFGISYDFPVIVKNYGNTGAFEVGLEYRSPVKPRPKRTKSEETKKPAIAKTGVSKKPTVSKPAVTAPLKPDSAQNKNATRVQKPPKSDTVESVRVEKTEIISTEAKAGKIKHDPLVIEKITLHFHFEYNSVDLDDETEKYLGELTATLAENGNLKLKITGFTDNRGNEKYNLHLSKKRAEEVKRFLVKSGIAAERITADGKGMSDPLNGNSTEEERSKNRRVEISVYFDAN
ncbi:MAG TPA: PorP/SprF family type IX secretion system membrane protein [Cyclobacteriaceae bacterium]|nr:PorP/SprF family type IX secretion system membrane protein [Cyclobacteriaceae bacterium]